MSLRRPISGDNRDDSLLLLIATHQAQLVANYIQRKVLELQRRLLRRKRKAAECRCRLLAAFAVGLCSKEKRIWSHFRPPSWYETTVPNLSDNDFKRNFRVTRSTFSYIVCKCQSLARADTNMRNAIPLHKRVAVALYRAATSAEERTVANLFGVSAASVNIIFHEFCSVIVDSVESQFVRMPTVDAVEEHIRQFSAVLGFPQGFGALDGCHIKVSPPKEHAQDYYNYKGWYSIILLALVDHNYKFLFTNVGSPGRNHDSRVYSRSSLPRVIESDLFSKPERVIEGVEVGAIILCDQAFPLLPNLMKPYSQRHTDDPAVQVYNYTLSKARRVVENAFGRLKARFRILKGLECDITKAARIVRTCCVLHNICEDMRDQCDMQWNDDEVTSLLSQPFCVSNAATVSGEKVRCALAKHLSVRS